jgi:phosphoribosylformylglycinamidine cyclo-ligase
LRESEVRALAHITGGGLLENIPRVLPNGLGVALDAAAWPLPPVFRWLAETAGIANEELARTFNCGIGMVAVVPPAAAAAATRILAAHGETVHEIGRVVECGDGPRVIVTNMAKQWPG